MGSCTGVYSESPAFLPLNRGAVGSPPPHRTSLTPHVWFLVVFVGAGVAVRAQDALPPAHLAVVDGNVTLEREQGLEAAAVGLPVVPGDRVRTTGGRAEILFPDGSTLDVDEYTTVDLQSDSLLRLVGGRVLLTFAGNARPTQALGYQLDTPVASARTEGAGEYRLTIVNGVSGLESELAVLRGTASLSTDSASTFLRAGERTMAREHSSPSAPQLFNSARFDAFDRWTSARRANRLGAASAQYLPRELQSYGGTFDRNGSWRYEPSYGYVWFPSVAPDWRPYYNGSWTTVPPYGWTWVGLDVWSWPTHHYGRWGVSGSRWFWIPGRRWSAAWVSWASAPGYVSWCPLGFDNRPVFSLTIASGNPWAGWTLVPRTHFDRPGRMVRSSGVATPSFSPRTSFVMERSAPLPATRAVPRGSRSATSAVDDSAPRGPTTAPRVPAPSETVRGRAWSRQEPRAAAPRADMNQLPPASPGFKRPLPDARPRRAETSAGPARPASTASALIAVPGTRPPGSRERGFGNPNLQRLVPEVAPESRAPAAMSHERAQRSASVPYGDSSRLSGDTSRRPGNLRSAPDDSSRRPDLQVGRSGGREALPPQGRAAARNTPARPGDSPSPSAVREHAPRAGARAAHQR